MTAQRPWRILGGGGSVVSLRTGVFPGRGPDPSLRCAAFRMTYRARMNQNPYEMATPKQPGQTAKLGMRGAIGPTEALGCFDALLHRSGSSGPEKRRKIRMNPK